MNSIASLRQWVALGLRGCSLYFCWKAVLFLFDYQRACSIYQGLHPGSPIADENGVSYLQGKYGDGVSLQLSHTILGYFLEYVVFAVLLWVFSIPLARLLTRDLENV